MNKTKLPITLLLAGTLMMSSLTMTACTSTPTDAGKPLPELTFEQINRIPVNVSRVNFINDTQRGAELWDSATATLPTPPDIAMRRYLMHRFQSNGTEGVLNITLRKADVKRSEVPHESKILSYIRMANRINYRFEYDIDIERLYFGGQPNLKSTVRFTRDARLAADASLAYRDAMLQRTLEELMRDIDEALITNIGYKFGLIAASDIPRRSLPVKTELPVEDKDAVEPIPAPTSYNAQPAPTPLVTAPVDQDNSVTVERLD